MSKSAQGQNLMEQVLAINAGFKRKYPDDHDYNNPNVMADHLLTECWTVNKMVGDFEDTDDAWRKVQGAPADKKQFLREIVTVVSVALQIAQHYGLEQDLQAWIEEWYQWAKAQGIV